MKRLSIVILAVLLALATLLASSCDAPPSEAQGEKGDNPAKGTESTTDAPDTTDGESTGDSGTAKEEATTFPENSDSSNDETSAEDATEPDDTGAEVSPETEPVEPPVEVIQQLVSPAEGLLDQIAKDYYYRALEIHEGDSSKVSTYYIERYFGTYNGAVPVVITVVDGEYPEVEHTETVAGYTFEHYCLNPIKVWKDGDFYSLQEAYDLGILTVEHVAQMYRLGSLYYENTEYVYPN